MKSTGIIRKVDELGRIVLPIELRRTLDIAERDELEIFMENDRIVLQKFEPACLFCGSSRALITYRGKNVCQHFFLFCNICAEIGNGIAFGQRVDRSRSNLSTINSSQQ